VSPLGAGGDRSATHPATGGDHIFQEESLMNAPPPGSPAIVLCIVSVIHPSGGGDVNVASLLPTGGPLPIASLVDLLSKGVPSAAPSPDDALLTLEQASEVSGYTTEYLRRLVRENRVPNHGVPYKPRVRRGDIPVKGSLARRGRAGRSCSGLLRDIVTSKRGS
jgi:hypothetical protein